MEEILSNSSIKDSKSIFAEAIPVIVNRGESKVLALVEREIDFVYVTDFTSIGSTAELLRYYPEVASDSRGVELNIGHTVCRFMFDHPIYGEVFMVAVSRLIELPV